jgi:hypothetical protein
LRYGLVGSLLSWSFTTLAVAAKNVMTSVPEFLLIETAFTIAQWAVVAPLTVVSTLPFSQYEPRVGASADSRVRG